MTTEHFLFFNVRGGKHEMFLAEIISNVEFLLYEACLKSFLIILSLLKLRKTKKWRKLLHERYEFLVGF